MITRKAIAITALVLATLAGSTFAQPKDDGNKDALKGPSVKDGGVPGENRKFNGGNGQPRKDRAREIPEMAFMRAIGALKGDKVAEADRLTAEQESKIKAINEEFRNARQKYVADHKQEITELRDQLPPRERRRVDGFLNVDGPKGPAEGRPKDGDAKKGPREDRKDDGMMEGDGQKVDEAKAEAARTKLKELLDNAPKPADSHAKVYAVLSDSQKKIVEGELARQREEMEKRGGRPGKDGPKREFDDSDEGPGGKKPEGAPKTGRPGGPGGDVREKMLEKLTPEEREKLKTMTPEERREFIKKKAQDGDKK
jgi:hypothetical protein